MVTSGELFFNRRSRAFLFLVVFTFPFSSCVNDPAEVARVTAKNNEPVEYINGLQTIYSDSGLVKVKVTAGEMKKMVSPAQVTELPKGLHIEFYNDQLKVESELTARYAIHYEAERKWVAKKDVVVVNRKGEKLNTEKLVWDERKELLSSDEHVKITTAEEVIFGKGFEANQDFSHYKILNVTGIITVKK
ncbi:MAG: LPS export ABC transporter periplasmic protein LptC [Bacteroidia bacterium]